MREFLYYLKLVDGRLVHSQGTGPEHAAAAAGIDFALVKRHMPVKRILTSDEIEARDKRIAMLRQRSVKIDTDLDLDIDQDA